MVLKPFLKTYTSLNFTSHCDKFVHILQCMVIGKHTSEFGTHHVGAYTIPTYKHIKTVVISQLRNLN